MFLVEHAGNQEPWLEETVGECAIADTLKALQIPIDYAKHESGQDEIFGDISCMHC